MQGDVLQNLIDAQENARQMAYSKQGEAVAALRLVYKLEAQLGAGEGRLKKIAALIAAIEIL